MLDWIKNTLTSSVTGSPSTKRLVMLCAAIALILVLLAIGSACSYWIAKHGDLGAGAAGALLTVAGTVTTISGVAYRKDEKPNA